MEKVLLGARLPQPVITELRSFCRVHGIVMNHFVTRAIVEKLLEEKEDEEDIITAQARKHDPSMSETEWNKYLKTRGINV